MMSESLAGVVAQTLLSRSDRPGLVPAIELLVVTPAVKNLIRENKSYQIPSIIQTSVGKGMISYEASIKGLLDKGIVSLATANAFLPTVNSSS